MARKNLLINGERLTGKEEIVISGDNKSLRRGRRSVPRTEVFRPCLVWHAETPDQKMEGILLDLNTTGLKLRMLQPLPIGSDLFVQMMRDDQFEVPLSHPIAARVVRTVPAPGGLVDLGLKLQLPKVKGLLESKTQRAIKRPAAARRGGRMHNIDFSVDNRGIRRTGRFRG